MHAQTMMEQSVASQFEQMGVTLNGERTTRSNVTASFEAARERERRAQEMRKARACQRKIREASMIGRLTGVEELWEEEQRRQRVDDDYEEYERSCRTEAIHSRRDEMGEQIFEDSQGEGTRTLLWAMEEDVEAEVRGRVEEQRILDHRGQEQK